MASKEYLGDVIASHEDENVDFLMSMMDDVEDRASRLMHQVQEMIVATYGEFIQVPREARLMIASSRVITEHVASLEEKIKLMAIPKLKNSTSVLNELSTRFSEISLTRKIVDELIKLNHGYIVAQEFQKEKKYFDAVKSFQALLINLENASYDVKGLNVYQLLVNETTQSRVNLMELMTTTLDECFKYEVKTGIDASKMKYYALKVDINRDDAIEESFKALHYLGQLSVFFTAFANWLSKNMILPIILHHCIVTNENEDGKYNVLKVEIDLTLPKCDFQKVFENILSTLSFLKSYLSVSIDENYTLMNELGKLTLDDFISTLINNCLEDTIPSHSNQLDEYKSVISATEQFHNSLKSIGFLGENNSKLVDYTTNSEKLCAKKTSKLLLIRAREIIKKDLYDAMEVEIISEAPKMVPVKKEELPEEDIPDPAETPCKESPKKDKKMLAEMKQMRVDFIKFLDKDDSLQQICLPRNATSENYEKNKSSSEDLELNEIRFKNNPDQVHSPIIKDSRKISVTLKNFNDQEDSSLKVGPEGQTTRVEINDQKIKNESTKRGLIRDWNSSRLSISQEEELSAGEGSLPATPKKLPTRESTVDESTDEEILSELTPENTSSKTAPTEDETNLNLMGAIYAFPKCQISKSANELICLLNEVLNDCVGSSCKCARNLFKTARLIVELYCAIAPIYHKKYLETIPQQAALYHNNCMYMAHSLLTLGTVQRMLLPNGTETIGSFADQVSVLRNEGASVFLAHMHIQRDQMLGIIRNSGFATLRECSTLTPDSEKTLRQCLRQLELLKSVWQPVLPINVYVHVMACLTDSFLDDLITRVITVQDIPADTASQLVNMFGVVITRVNAIFPDAQMMREFDKWEMFQELVLILGANMKFIAGRWANGQGPAAAHFTADQLRQLIRALFQNTERRAAILADIR